MNDVTQAIEDLVAKIPLERVIQVGVIIFIAVLVQLIGGRAISKSDPANSVAPTTNNSQLT